MVDDISHEDIARFEFIGGYRLRVWFKDGAFGEVDISALISFRGEFAPLEDELYFRQAHINPETFVLAWPNGSEIDPARLYAKATGKPLKIRVWREEEIPV